MSNMKPFQVIFLLIFFCCNIAVAQNEKGQVLLNGNTSFFTNNSVKGGDVSASVVDGVAIPAFSYEQKQDVYNLTLAPKAHYFLSSKWSIGLGFGWRRIVNDRYISSIEAEEVPTHILFTRQTKNKSTTSSYSPQLECARHWGLGEHLTITLSSYLGWQYVQLKQETSVSLPLTAVSNLDSWEVSENGLRFSPQHQDLEHNTTNEQLWFLGLYPQLRYNFTEHFGMTAIFGGIGLLQEYENSDTDFIKAKPALSVNLNPSSWTFGLFWIFKKEEMN